ncbi:MAG: hypothetical protein KME26_18715 [Oscillatoria princeps RMCB-10]|jgi:uncharacterized protein YggT (Ycf19 family)|nr:hypothetical protein [Oscillatoria princeps RMCB-10]
MAELCTALLCLILLVVPVISVMRFLADFISDKMGDLPFLPWLFVKPSTSLNKGKLGYASPEELRHAVRVTVVISGTITALILHHLLGFVIFWVLAICFLVSFVDSN